MKIKGSKKMQQKSQPIRTFSTAFKKEKVELIERGEITVSQLSRVYEVSKTAIYNWIHKYSKYSKNERIVVEKISEESKALEYLKRIAELERVLGKKQMDIDYYESLIEAINEEFGYDVKKKLRL